MYNQSMAIYDQGLVIYDQGMAIYVQSMAIHHLGAIVCEQKRAHASRNKHMQAETSTYKQERARVSRDEHTRAGTRTCGRMRDAGPHTEPPRQKRLHVVRAFVRAAGRGWRRPQPEAAEAAKLDRSAAEAAN